MGPRRIVIGTLIATLYALTGCATSALDEQRRKDMEADIDEILTYQLDETEVGGPRNCLSDREYRSFRALGDRHLLFEGRNDKQWVNVIRGHCPGLDDDGFFVMQLFSGGRLCDKDRFDVADRLDFAMSQGGALMAPTCILGMFQPVVKAQVDEIEKRLEMR